jgi:hypothetical protein
MRVIYSAIAGALLACLFALANLLALLLAPIEWIGSVGDIGFSAVLYGQLFMTLAVAVFGAVAAYE